jgi:tetratricopeptide (TPR) repeat protein
VGLFFVAASLVLAQAPKKTPAAPKLPPPQQQPTTSVQRLLARDLIKQGDAERAKNRLDEAERKYLQAIAAVATDEFTPESAAALRELSGIYVAEGRREEATDSSLAALLALQACYQLEECGRSLTLIQIRTARAHLAATEPKRAEAIIRRLLEKDRERGLSPDEQRIAMQLFLQFLEDTAQPAQAGVIRDQIKESFAKPGGSVPPLPAFYPAGEPVARPELKSPEEKQGYFEMLFRCAAANSRVERPAQSEVNLRAIAAFGEKEKSIDRDRVILVHRAIVTVLWDQRKRDEAVEAARYLAGFIEREKKPETSFITGIHFDLGMRLANMQKRQESIEEFDKAIAAGAKCTERQDCDPLIATAQGYKGLLMIALGNFEEGNALIKPLLDDKHGHIPKDQYTNILTTYANSLDVYGREEDAKIVRTKLASSK